MKILHINLNALFLKIFLSYILILSVIQGSDSLLWVYTGFTDSNNTFKSKYFINLKQKAEINDTLHPMPNKTMYLRETPPQKTGSIWIKTNKLSILDSGMGIHVEETADVNTTIYEDKRIIAHWVGGSVFIDDNNTDCNCWYVVVASEPTLEEANNFVNTIKDDINTSIYLSTNNYFTVVVGWDMNQSKAKETILNTIKKDIGENPYIWPSRNWKEVKVETNNTIPFKNLDINKSD